MLNNHARGSRVLIFLIFLLGLMQSAFAETSFRIRDIEFQGLAHLPQSTAQHYFPLKAHDMFKSSEADEVIDKFFKSGYFQQIALYQDGSTLIVRVQERPVIAQVDIEGNEAIKKKDLENVLKQLNLTAGNVSNPFTVLQLKSSLEMEYAKLGKYDVRIDIKEETLPRNRIALKINIAEGVAAKIERITFIGNKAFDHDTLSDQITLTTPGLWAFFTSSDEFSEQKQAESINKLRDYYFNRGYVHFNVESSQVSFDQSLKRIFLTYNLREGEQYHFGQFSLSGDFVVPQAQLAALVDIVPGDVFDRSIMQRAVSSMVDALGDAGYAFAHVEPMITIDEKAKTVIIDFKVMPGKKTFVRFINFKGNNVTNDAVFRERMLFPESSVYSRTKLHDSLVRFQRLAYVKNIKHHVEPVSDRPDQADVDFDITEESANSVQGSIGYSGLDKLIFGLQLNMPNIFGTGNIFNTGISWSHPAKSVNFSFTQPYFTLDGVSQSVNFYLDNVDNKLRDLANYSTNSYGGELAYSIPVSVDDSIDVGLGYDFTHLIRARDTNSQTVDDFINAHGNEYHTYMGRLGWSRLSTNEAFFPTEGVQARIGSHFSLPSSSVYWYKLYAESAWYHPVFNSGMAISFSGAVRYGNGYGKTDHLPFFRNSFLGGWSSAGSVRGYDQGTLGPRDQVCPKNGDPCYEGNPLGGNLSTVMNVNLYIPLFWADDSRRMRFVVFGDAGNVYTTYHLSSASNTNLPTSPSFNNLRYGVGVGFEWASPMGYLAFSLAKPLNVHAGDKTRNFQFYLGKHF